MRAGFSDVVPSLAWRALQCVPLASMETAFDSSAVAAELLEEWEALWLMRRSVDAASNEYGRVKAMMMRAHATLQLHYPHALDRAVLFASRCEVTTVLEVQGCDSLSIAAVAATFPNLQSMSLSCVAFEAEDVATQCMPALVHLAITESEDLPLQFVARQQHLAVLDLSFNAYELEVLALAVAVRDMAVLRQLDVSQTLATQGVLTMSLPSVERLIVGPVSEFTAFDRRAFRQLQRLTIVVARALDPQVHAQFRQHTGALGIELELQHCVPPARTAAQSDPAAAPRVPPFRCGRRIAEARLLEINEQLTVQMESGSFDLDWFGMRHLPPSWLRCFTGA